MVVIEKPEGRAGRCWWPRVWVRLVVSGLLLAGLAGTPAEASPVEGAAGTATWVWPLQPKPPVVRGFDPPDQPWQSGHRGVDLLGRVGQQVHAAGAGTVTYAGLLAGRGVVTVDHGALRTTYEPVSASVHVGERLHAGQAIGVLALIGGHCLPRACLHWGLLRGDVYLNPLSLVGAGPVRLLPLRSGGGHRVVGAGPVRSAVGAAASGSAVDPRRADASGSARHPVRGQPAVVARPPTAAATPWVVVALVGAGLGGAAWMLAWVRRR